MIANPVANSYDDIRARRAQIREQETPQCPLIAARTLYDCLRSSSQCSENCPLRGDWIGPDIASWPTIEEETS